MRRPVIAVITTLAILVTMTTLTAQIPGDRPSGNIAGTRSPAVGRHGMIATSQSLASAAGLRVLQNGGNAIDAAVTAAAVLAVVEPSMNGIGGDLFAIVYDAKTKKTYALDASGRAPAAATPEEFAKRGITEMPGEGVLTVDVPGVVSGWDALLTRFGTISMKDAVQPAIGYARDGFPVAELMAAEWQDAAARLAKDPHAKATFLPNGTAPTWPNHHASSPSSQAIARSARPSFGCNSRVRVATSAGRRIRSALGIVRSNRIGATSGANR